MKIQLVGSMKISIAGGAVKTIQAGTTFDDTKEPIPADILIAFKNNSPKLKAIIDPLDVKTHTIGNEQIQATLKELEEVNVKLNEARNIIGEKDFEIARLQEELKNFKIASINAGQDVLKANAPWVCPVCERNDFANGDELEAHIKKVHKGKKDKD
jgi:hypothetical protein